MRNLVPILLACLVPLIQMQAAQSPAAPPPAPTASETSEWAALQESFKAPPTPKEWLTVEPTKADLALFRAFRITQALKASDQAGKFAVKYPSSSNGVEARITQYMLVGAAIEMGDTNQNARADSLESKLVGDKSIPEGRRLEIAVRGLQRQAELKRGEGIEAFLGELEKGVRRVRRDFPDRQEGYGLMAQMVQFYSRESLAEPATRLARELQQSPASDEIKQTVQTLVRRFEFIGKPFEFKAKSATGSELDVSKMRGKVVLIDFWASWCQPCLISIPVLKDAYGRFKAKGFEIIGVNLDDDREAMDRVLKKLEMTWPQHFDGQARSGPIPTKFGVDGIPSMWLIDKRGVLREVIQGISPDPALHGEFIKKIEVLMKEPPTS